jgi:hypothetical protein
VSLPTASPAPSVEPRSEPLLRSNGRP